MPFSVIIQAGVNIEAFKTISIRKNITIFDYCDNNDYDNFIKKSKIIITHGGVGVISAAISAGKLPAVFGRRASLSEHINDHQLDFLQNFSEDGIYVRCQSPENLKDFIIHTKWKNAPSRSYITHSEQLRDDIQKYIYSVI